MQMLLGLKEGIPVNAAAEGGVVADLAAVAAKRPDRLTEFRKLTPEFDAGGCLGEYGRG